MNLTREALSNLVRDNFIYKNTYLAERTDSMDVQVTAGYVRVDSGLRSDTFNVIVPLEKELKALDGVHIANALHYLTGQNKPMALWTWEDRNGSTCETLQDLGLIAAETNIAMAAKLAEMDMSAGMPEHFQIREVRSKEDIKLFGDVLASLFGESEEAVNVRGYYNVTSELLLESDSAMQLYIGCVGLDAVATGTLVIADNSVGIYDIATREEYRGKGYGSAMFSYLVEAAKGKAPEYCVLQASADGINIYKRAGFEEVCEVTVYEKIMKF
ncbi:GNAT family N-acetyltransferase [Paenibacillus sp. N1-5-1-14]|uniref:GNAT family N-acetyltransferase n=1 Tax=Paenibacillus radicibacter TaxID=2972488 RepID=UPI0021599597|nr:GNAT family N-acetyltransferase [Paenibacillus radicibacter]MCR8644605.1 GNAT family N-acetyltransferase [Paenibacillus radicibacter]